MSCLLSLTRSAALLIGIGRCAGLSYGQCLRSIFQHHNETGEPLCSRGLARSTRIAAAAAAPGCRSGIWTADLQCRRI